MINTGTVKNILEALNSLMAENKDYLIELDSKMGDGDLGLTMSSSFAAAWEQLKDSDESDPGKLFAKAGMIIAKTAPSTMGTLIATGFMRGGKAVTGSTSLDGAALGTFFRAFADGLMERGKTAPGEKTVVDVFDPVAFKMADSAKDDPGDLLVEAAAYAEECVDLTREMKAQHGRAAYYQEQSIGQQDPGATAGAIIIRGFLNGYKAS